MIISVRRGFIVGAMMLVASSLALAQNTALTPEQVATIEKEVILAIQNYYRLYSEKDNKAIGPEVFLEPWLQLGTNGPTVTHTGPPAEIAKQFAANVERLTAQGWVRSEFPKPIVCVVNAGTAIASGEFTRYRQDGSVLNVNGTTYLLTKTSSGWRIASFFGHERGKVVGCNDGM